MERDPNCIFCHIVVGDGDASVVHRDDLVTAFMDISPIVAGHILVVPNYHTTGLAGLDDEHGARMMSVGKRIANALPDSGLRCEGSNLFLANGKVAGQTVFHVHLHVIPRYKGDPFRVQIESFKRGVPSRGTLDRQAAEVVKALG
jgi:diadenosine tetraphosphate (Ap4A) HIT family hydrolase